MRPRSALKPTPPAAFPPAPPPQGSPPARIEVDALPVTNAYWAGSEVVVLRRGPDRTLHKQRFPAEHSAFLPRDKVFPALLAELRSSRNVVGVREDGEHYRVSFAQRRVALRAAEEGGPFVSRGIPVYEADVDPVRRWLTDNPVEIAKPRRAYLDLETDSRVPFSRGHEARILCWSVADHDGNELGELLAEDTDEAERRLLRSLFRALADYDSVIAWNGDRFDFPRIGARAEHLGVGVELRRWLWLDHMRLFLKMNVSAAESGEEKQFAGLERIAQALHVEGATKSVQFGELGGPTPWGMWEAGGEERRMLLEERCRGDARLLLRIEEKTGYVDLLETLCQSTHTLPDSRGMMPTRYVEGFLLRLGAARGMRFASRVFERDDDEGGEGDDEQQPRERSQFKGAYVLEPTQLGVIRDVHVCDFARLYPSVIQTWNMSPETVTDVRLVETARPVYLRHLPNRPRPIPAGHCAAALTDVVFRNEPRGILPEGVGEMLRLRKHWDDRKKAAAPGTPEWKEADRRSAAYKIAANAFYGVVGSPFSRFFVREVAESVSQSGVWLIQQTMEAIASRGWKTIYADTDSAFVVGCDREQFADFVAWCDRELYPRLVAERGCTRNHTSLAYEKAFKTLVLVSKKRYAASYAHFKGKDATADSKPEIKGLEYKRGDAARLARRMQAEVIERLLAGDDDPAHYVEVVERYRAHVLTGELEREDVVLSKRLARPLREYAERHKEPPKRLEGCRVSVSVKGARRVLRGRVVRATPSYLGVEVVPGERVDMVQRSEVGALVVYAAQSPHIEVARLLEHRGRDVGAGVRIEYVVMDAAAEPPVYIPVEDWAPGAACDRHYLWESLVYPPTQRVLEVVFRSVDWRRWERSRPKRGNGTGDLFAGGPAAAPVAAPKPPAGPPAGHQAPARGRQWRQETLF